MQPTIMVCPCDALNALISLQHKNLCVNIKHKNVCVNIKYYVLFVENPGIIPHFIRVIVIYVGRCKRKWSLIGFLVGQAREGVGQCTWTHMTYV